jgi:Flp pilus assembly protein TadG
MDLLRYAVMTVPMKPSSQKGQSLMEMAFATTVMLILLGGIVDLGRAFFTYMALRDAVQEGAMYGSLHPTATVEIKNMVRDSSSMVADMISADDITVELLGPACTGNGLRVTAVYNDFPLTMPFMGTILGSQTIPLRASITATILNPWCSL